MSRVSVSNGGKGELGSKGRRQSFGGDQSSVFGELVQQLTECYHRDMKEAEGCISNLRAELEKLRAIHEESKVGFQSVVDFSDEDDVLLPGEVQVPEGDAPTIASEEDAEDSHHGRHTSFDLHESWAQAYRIGATRKSLGTSQSMSNEKDEDEEQLAPDMVVMEYEGRMKRLIAYPASKYRVVWDMVGGIMIMYDMITIPMKVFNYPETAFTIACDWITLLYWTINVYATLTVGFVKDGVTIVSPKIILINYLKTWFIVDVVVLLPDWIGVFLGDAETGDSGESVRLLRMLRLARIVRLVRLLKLKWIMDIINDHMDSEYMSVVINIIKMIVLLLCLNHLIACIWFEIGMNRDGVYAMGWVEAYEVEVWEYQYLTAFHWSITQFTPSSMHIQPQNIGERTFAIAIVVFALIGFSYVVGSITGSLTQLRSMSEGVSKEFWLLRRFLKRNSVPVELGLRIKRFVEHAHSKQQEKMTMGQVKILSLLSGQLHDELMRAMNLPHLQVHPLFAFLNEKSPITTQRLAKEAVGRQDLAKGDTQFLPDQEATMLFFVSSGRFQYRREPLEGQTKARVEMVDAGEDWIAEPTLWTPHWVHVGELKAYTEAELVSVNPSKFSEILTQYVQVAYLVAQYGRAFMTWMEKSRKDGDLSDVIQGDLISDAIAAFIPSEDQTKSAAP